MSKREFGVSKWEKPYVLEIPHNLTNRMQKIPRVKEEKAEWIKVETKMTRKEWLEHADSRDQEKPNK